MSDKILFVDDEQNLLDGIKRDLFDVYDITTALGGEEGLALIEQGEAFSVIVSDMRMPIMDGATFLAKVKENSPDSIRIMLTGNTDLGTAVSAVNEGNIFRFINKPCNSDTLQLVLNAAIEQYHLIHAEKELLENTFQGGINVLVDILGLTNPVAFSRATRVKYFASKLAQFLKLEDVWKYEVAALLSQIGCVTIPPDVLEKVYLNQGLDPQEKEMLKQYPKVGHDLIAHIPRMETVAKMIAHQNVTLDESEREAEIETLSPNIIGAGILRLSIDYDTLWTQGLTRSEVLEELQKNEAYYHPKLLYLMRKVLPPLMEKKVTMSSILELNNDMALEADVQTKEGILLAKKGQDVTSTMRIMFENHLKQKNIDKRILVSVPIKPKEEKS